GLAEDERREPVVVHVALLVRDVEEARGPRVPQEVAEREFEGLSVLAAAGGVAGGEEGQGPHADQAEVVRLPVSFRPLVESQPGQAPLESVLALRRDLPVPFGGRPRAEEEEAEDGGAELCPVHG